MAKDWEMNESESPVTENIDNSFKSFKYRGKWRARLKVVYFGGSVIDVTVTLFSCLIHCFYCFICF